MQRNHAARDGKPQPVTGDSVRGIALVKLIEYMPLRFEPTQKS